MLGLIRVRRVSSDVLRCRTSSARLALERERNSQPLTVGPLYVELGRGEMGEHGGWETDVIQGRQQGRRSARIPTPVSEGKVTRTVARAKRARIVRKDG